MPITTNYEEILERLGAFFAPEDVAVFPFRTTKDKSKGVPAFYVDSRAVRRRLDETVYWQSEYKEGPDGGVIAGISILVSGPDGLLSWWTRWDGATNTGMDGDDMAVKGGLSNALRRAAVNWNVGQYLYDVGRITNKMWLELDTFKKFVKPPVLPAEFLPDGVTNGAVTNGAVVDKFAPDNKAKKSGKAAAAAASPVERKAGISNADAKRLLAAGVDADKQKANAVLTQVKSGKMDVDIAVAKLKQLSEEAKAAAADKAKPEEKAKPAAEKAPEKKETAPAKAPASRAKTSRQGAAKGVKKS